MSLKNDYTKDGETHRDYGPARSHRGYPPYESLNVWFRGGFCWREDGSASEADTNKLITPDSVFCLGEYGGRWMNSSDYSNKLYKLLRSRL
jgi:hypothetical protein